MPCGGASNLPGSELLTETLRSPEPQTLTSCVVSSDLTASTSKCLLARCFQEPDSHLSWPHLTKRDPLRVAKPCCSPELDPPGSFAFLGGCSQGVLLGWERPPRFSPGQRKEELPLSFLTGKGAGSENLPLLQLKPTSSARRSEENLLWLSCCVRAELLEPPIAGPGLGSSSNTETGHRRRVDCWARAWETHIASHRSGRKIEEEDFGHVVPIKMNAKCFESI